ncbi:guanine nucleotide exchange factor MSS4 homolog [Chelonus insularis]|uniref:guanine nucleotide exchange factor MSS4 homolog n=1 Tax=Chelonus insularis TaxID=460826 RepID=UPI001589AE23|nr:guanine nucleotide exchange factor MSS4 homolog [Chelonus insularis]
MSSTSDTEINQEEQKNVDRKNKAKICCRFCPSVILNVGTSTFIPHEFPLPHIHSKGTEENEKVEIIKDYWVVDKGLYEFENVSITKIVDKIKYLGCADCEVGPIGYMDLSTEKYYVAVSRVMYRNDDSKESKESEQ